MNHFNDFMKIAQIHAMRIEGALEKLEHIHPITEKVLEELKEEDFLQIELFMARFSKLQDFMGAKLIDAFLEGVNENTQNLSMLDKLNKLERLGVFEDVGVWMQMRDVRNHLAHEYPDKADITASYLNKVFMLAPKLLDLLNKMGERYGVK